MQLSKIIRDYFSFSRNDRIAVIVLLILISGVACIPYFFPAQPGLPSQLPLSSLFVNDSGSSKLQGHNDFSVNDAPAADEPPPLRHFRFDPNTLDEAGWQKLGLSARTAATILKYRSKGGRFRKPEDLSRIWGLPPGFYNRIATDIMIEDTPPSTHQHPDKTGNDARAPYQNRIDVNLADSAAFESLPGIGPTLARRIVDFRNKLGGFFSTEQLAETFGLPDSTFQKVRHRLRISGGVQLLPLNTASQDQLKNHPYVRWKLATAIVNYRSQHGAFQSFEELKNLPLVNDSLLKKLKPYLSIK